MKIIIYATHSYGTYPELVKNKNVVVLGFGDTWEGFIKKAKTITNYLTTLPPDEIVSILDGFDSVINKTEGLEEAFKSMNCKVLISKEEKSGFSKVMPEFMENYIKWRVFGTCKDNVIANSGLIMGYAGYLKIVWESISHGESGDDQRNLNQSCSRLPFLKVDTSNKIFKNCDTTVCIGNSQSYFSQLPGEMSWSRAKRAMVEYPKFFIPEIIIILLLLLLLIKNKRKR